MSLRDLTAGVRCWSDGLCCLTGYETGSRAAGGCGGIPTPEQERIDELPEQGGRHGLVDAVAGRLLVPGKVEGAKEAVDEGPHGRVVFINDPFERTEAPADIGVDEEAPHRPEKNDQDGNQATASANGRGETQDVKRGKLAEPGEDHIDRMGAGAE